MDGLAVFLIALAVCLMLLVAKPLIFKGLNRISGRHHEDH